MPAYTLELSLQASHEMECSIRSQLPRNYTVTQTVAEAVLPIAALTSYMVAYQILNLRRKILDRIVELGRRGYLTWT